MTMVRRAFLVLIIPALAAGMMVSVARAQTPIPDDREIPSLDIHPVGTTDLDPNGGQWFVANAEPGESTEFQVRLTNTADVEQTVKLYLADIVFDPQGIPEVTNVPTDVGTWGAFKNPTATIGPHAVSTETFTITVPEGVDPGDHVGAVVAEHAAQGSGNVRSIKRIAVRLYVTLPGDATRDFVIDAVTAKKDRWFFASKLDVTVALRNTGRVRLEPVVTVDDEPTKGASLLMSQAIERYTITRPLGFFGGPIRLRVSAQSRSLGQAGPARELRATVWVIPWHLFVIIIVVAGLVFLVRRFLKSRRSKYTDIQADIRRIERLVSQQMRQTGGTNAVNGRNDGGAAIRAAIKQARRAGDDATAERLEHALHGGGAPSSAPAPGPSGPSRGSADPWDPRSTPPSDGATSPYPPAPPDVVPPSPWTS